MEELPIPAEEFLEPINLEEVRELCESAEERVRQSRRVKGVVSIDKKRMRHLQDVLKMCNCARCDREILGESMRVWYRSLKQDSKEKYHLIGGRVDDRPYCVYCFRIKQAGVRSPWTKVIDYTE